MAPRQTQEAITAPVALSCTQTVTITLPWFVQKAEYYPAPTLLKPLVDGKQAFGAVYDAIKNAKHTIDILCWGFQPSMCFDRNGSGSQSIGRLLEEMGAQGRKIRLLVWVDPTHFAEFLENNVPGYSWMTDAKALLPTAMQDYQTKSELEFDRGWYMRASLSDVTREGLIGAVWKDLTNASAHVKEMFGLVKKIPNLEFATRSFDLVDRFEIAFRTALFGTDTGRSVPARMVDSADYALFPSHHQKMVLIDYEDPDNALGFVMGHNMLDQYWDSNAHRHQPAPDPQSGRSGAHPWHDLSSRVTGPILDSLNANFCQAWDDATGQRLGEQRKSVWEAIKPDGGKFVWKQSGLRCDMLDAADRDEIKIPETPTMAQVVRTQSQHGVRDIETMYLQALYNTCQFIFIQNQYFRWPAFADAIKEWAGTLKAARGDAQKAQHAGSETDAPDEVFPPLYLFVITNASDDAMGLSTMSTYRTLDGLGQGYLMSGISKEEQQKAWNDATNEVNAQQAQVNRLGAVQNSGGLDQSDLAIVQRKLEQAKARQNALIPKDYSPTDPLIQGIDGLKSCICTLVAPDSPGDKWEPIYVHAKMMIVDDVFTTIGSANLNPRSMEVDSELNIFHENMHSTQPLRRALWGLHTKDCGIPNAASDDAGKAFKAWSTLIDQNAKNQKAGVEPIASLVKFWYPENKRTYLD